MLLYLRRNLFIFLMILIGAGATIGALGMGCTSKQKPEENTAGPATSNVKVLNVYGWANYFSPEMIKAFEEKSGAKVNLSFFTSNEELLAKLQAGARGYDVIVPTGYLVRALKELKLIQPLGKVDWQELGQLVPRAKAPPYDPNHEYTVPYAWGTTGIAVNRAKVKDHVDSWKWVFAHPELKGQVTMLDDAASVIGVALKYLGYSYNEGSPEALDKAKKLLLKQKTWLKAYTPETQPVLDSGEVAVAHVYSGDAMQVNRRNKNIEYVLPKEGGELFMDNLAIPVGAPSPELAKEFIHFTLERKIAAKVVTNMFFSAAVDVHGVPGIETLDSNPAVFPTEAQLKNYESMNDDPKRMEAVQRLWTELKSS